MNLNELKDTSREMLATFVNTIGLNGDWYSEINSTPIAWGIPPFDAPGKFLSPGSEELDNILKKQKCDDKTKKLLNNKGIILINYLYKQQEPSPDLYVTLIHETLHANRDLLLLDVFRDNKNESAYSYNNGKFEQNTKEFSSKHVDSSQDILKGNIDTSRATINSYASKTSEEIEDLELQEGKVDAQIEKQIKVDEALVEIMAVLSYRLYKDTERGKNSDIWSLIDKLGNIYIEEFYELRDMDSEFKEMSKDTINAKDRAIMCNILSKHHDFELFNWMLDPITYSQGDIHYDFFSDYTKNDQDLLDKLYNDECDFVLEDEHSLDSISAKEITTSDVKKIANSETSIRNIPSSFKDTQQAQASYKSDVDKTQEK